MTGFFYAYRTVFLLMGICLLWTVITGMVMPGAWSTVLEGEILLMIQLVMGYFIAVLAFLKLLDVRAFAVGFGKYDLVAQRWPRWGLMYPWLELAVGVGILAGAYVRLVGVGALVLGILGGVSVAYALWWSRQKKAETLHCACTGGRLQVPLGSLSFLENVAMAVMGCVMLLL